MRTKKTLWKFCMEIYRQMYKEANPSVNFDELMTLGVTKEHDWFMKYYLSEKRESEIIKEICKLHKCNQLEIRAIKQEVCLGSAPTSSFEAWRKHVGK